MTKEIAFTKEELAKHSVYNYETLRDFNDIILINSKQETLTAVVSENINTIIASKPGRKAFYDYFTDLTFFTQGMKESIKTFGSYAGAVIAVISMFFAIHSGINCMLGFNRTFQESSKSTVRDKINCIMSPIHYLLEKERKSTIYLTPENVNQLKALMSSKEKQNTDVKEI